SDATWPFDLVRKGRGRVKTQACCGAVEWRSQASNVLSFSREARHLPPSESQTPRFLHFCRAAHVLPFRATMCRAECDLEACWNRILTIFNPYTFSHSQGQLQSSSPRSGRLKSASAIPPIPGMTVIVRSTYA